MIKQEDPQRQRNLILAVDSTPSDSWCAQRRGSVGATCISVSELQMNRLPEQKGLEQQLQTWSMAGGGHSSVGS